MVDGKKLYGMDAELHFKMKAKEDPGTYDRPLHFSSLFCRPDWGHLIRFAAVLALVEARQSMSVLYFLNRIARSAFFLKKKGKTHHVSLQSGRKSVPNGSWR